jgi:hypothetical protein
VRDNHGLKRRFHTGSIPSGAGLTAFTTAHPRRITGTELAQVRSTRGCPPVHNEVNHKELPMKRLLCILLGTALAGAAVAQTREQSAQMEKERMHMRAMDTNSDGMVTREEFMKFHESMWNKTKRDKQGRATLADVHSVYGPMGTVKP